MHYSGLVSPERTRVPRFTAGPLTDRMSPGSGRRNSAPPPGRFHRRPSISPVLLSWTPSALVLLSWQPSAKTGSPTALWGQRCEYSDCDLDGEGSGDWVNAHNRQFYEHSGLGATRDYFTLRHCDDSYWDSRTGRLSSHSPPISGFIPSLGYIQFPQHTNHLSSSPKPRW